MCVNFGKVSRIEWKWWWNVWKLSRRNEGVHVPRPRVYFYAEQRVTHKRVERRKGSRVFTMRIVNARYGSYKRDKGSAGPKYVSSTPGPLQKDTTTTHSADFLASNFLSLWREESKEFFLSEIVMSCKFLQISRSYACYTFYNISPSIRIHPNLPFAFLFSCRLFISKKRDISRTRVTMNLWAGKITNIGVFEVCEPGTRLQTNGAPLPSRWFPEILFRGGTRVCFPKSSSWKHCVFFTSVNADHGKASSRVLFGGMVSISRP